VFTAVTTYRVFNRVFLSQLPFKY